METAKLSKLSKLVKRVKLKAAGSVGLDPWGSRALVAVAGSLCALALAALFVYRAGSVAVLNEDAFISFRYAGNLLAGHGLVFNPGGERVEGITNLLWTLLIAASSQVSGASLPEVALFLGVLCGALTVCVVYLWSYREIARISSSRALPLGAALVAPGLLCLAPGFAFYSATGLEVGLFALLLTGGLYLLSEGSRGGSPGLAVAGSVIFGLAAATRPEGVLALAFGVLAYPLAEKGATLARRLRRLVIVGSPGAAVVLVLTLWRLYYYGALLPNTAYAKAGGLEVAWMWGLPYVLNAALSNWFVLAWLVALAGAVLDRSFLLRSAAVLAITPVWAAYLVYAGGDYMPFHRLLVPLLPALLVVAVAGFARLVTAPTYPVGSGGASWRRAAAGGALAGALLLPFATQLPGQLEAEQAIQEEWRGDNADRREVAAWFRENAPDALVARNGVGALGYYTELRIVDMLGLNNAHIARRGQKEPRFTPGHQSGDGDYVLGREPDYIMPTGGLDPPYSFVSNRELARSAEFSREYRRMEVTLESGRSVPVYERKQSARAGP